MATIVERTVGPTGDYATLFALEAVGRDLVSNDEIWIVTMENFQDTTVATWAGWTTSSTNYLHIKAADEHGSVGELTTNAYRMQASSGSCLGLSQAGNNGYVIFEGLQFVGTGGANIIGLNLTSVGADTTWVFRNCLIESDGTARALDGNHTSGNSEIIFEGCLLKANQSLGCNCNQVTKFRNSTVILTPNFAYAVDFNNVSGCEFINSYTGCDQANSIPFLATTGVTFTNAYSWTGTANSTEVGYDTSNFENVTYGTLDLQLKDVADNYLLALYGGGTDISGYDYTQDLRGFTFDQASPEAGCLSYEDNQVASGNALFVFM